MQSPPINSTTSPRSQPSEPEAPLDRKFEIKADINVKAPRSRLSDGQRQTNVIFEEAKARQRENSQFNSESTKSEFRHSSATSTISRTTENFEANLSTAQADGGAEPEVKSREISDSTQNLIVRSNKNGRWTIMPIKMRVAGQKFDLTGSFNSPTQRYTKSDANPVSGPYTASQGAEFATKMLENIAHLNGKDLISTGSLSRWGGEVGSAITIMNAIKATNSTSDQVFVYHVSGEPAAVMKGEMQSYFSPARFHISYVVSDPYARGAGTALIEKAVNISLQNGGSGTVTLEAASGGAVNQYKKIGFASDLSAESSVFTYPMKLDPISSDMWKVNEDEHYSYAGNLGQKYITGLEHR